MCGHCKFLFERREKNAIFDFFGIYNAIIGSAIASNSLKKTENKEKT